MERTAFQEFEQLIQYSFHDKKLLALALTHSAYGNEHKRERHENNERIEFLGDAALDLIVSAYIYQKFPDMPEGELTKLRAGVVCESSLAKIAGKFRLGEFLLLGKGEEITGGRLRDSILADAMEAVIGAVYMDGGFAAAEQFVLSFMREEIDRMKESFKTIGYYWFYSFSLY